MKKYSPLLAVLLVAGCASPNGPAAPAATTGQADTVATGGAQTAPAGYQLAGASSGTADETSIVVRYKAGHEMRALTKGRVKRNLSIERTQVLEVANAAERDALIEQLQNDPAVEFAEPDYKMHAYYTPNDPSWSKQWDMTKIAMPAAWDVTKGASTVTVAVIDTGVDYNHPDLAGKVIKGRDFVGNDADPMDDQGHGTHVAGTIGALMGNGTGVAGVAPGVKLLAVKVLGGDGSGSTSGIADGINYAVTNGAKVINLSLGGPQPASVLKTAVDNAIAKGVVVVVASGNDSASTANYPAAYPGVISVGATGSSDSKDSYSNYHSSVAIAAPGSNIYSTTKGGSYGNMTGTSMASPHVAGAAALVKSLHPDWSVSQIRTALVSTGDTANGFNSSVKRMNVAKALAYGGGGTAPAPTPTTAPTTAPVPAPTTAPTPAPTTGDKTAPLMSRMSASFTTSTVAIRWMTNEPADTQIEIGLTSNPTSRSAFDARLVTSHASSVKYLSKGTRYYFRARSRDKAGNLRVSPVYSFVTRNY